MCLNILSCCTVVLKFCRRVAREGEMKLQLQAGRECFCRPGLLSKVVRLNTNSGNSSSSWKFTFPSKTLAKSLSLNSDIFDVLCDRIHVDRHSKRLKIEEIN